MKRNMDRTFGLIYSQRILLALIDKGLVREEAYDTVQPFSNAGLGRASSIPYISRCK